MRETQRTIKQIGAVEVSAVLVPVLGSHALPILSFRDVSKRSIQYERWVKAVKQARIAFVTHSAKEVDRA